MSHGNGAFGEMNSASGSSRPQYCCNPIRSLPSAPRPCSRITSLCGLPPARGGRDGPESAISIAGPSASASRQLPSVLHVLEPEAVSPALDVAYRGRREMHRAAERIGVAVALEEAPPRRNGLVAVGIDAHDQLGVAGLDRRVDQVAGEYRLIAAAPGADREMIGRVPRSRRQPDMIVQFVVAGDEFGAI